MRPWINKDDDGDEDDVDDDHKRSGNLHVPLDIFDPDSPNISLPVYLRKSKTQPAPNGVSLPQDGLWLVGVSKTLWSLASQKQTMHNTCKSLQEYVPQMFSCTSIFGIGCAKYVFMATTLCVSGEVLFDHLELRRFLKRKAYTTSFVSTNAYCFQVFWSLAGPLHSRHICWYIFKITKTILETKA